MRSHTRLFAPALRASIVLMVLMLALGCATLTRGHVGAQVHSRYPYSTDLALPRPLAKWRLLRRATMLAVAAVQREIQRRQSIVDPHMTRAEALSVWLPGAPVVR